MLQEIELIKYVKYMSSMCVIRYVDMFDTLWVHLDRSLTPHLSWLFGQCWSRLQAPIDFGTP